MQRANERESNLYHTIEEITKKTITNYKCYLNGSEFNFSQYPYLSFTDLSYLVNELDERSLGFETNILSDVVNMNNTYAVVGNIYQNLTRSMYRRLYPFSDDEFNKELLMALKQRYYLIEYLEAKIRSLLFKIVNDNVGDVEDIMIRGKLANHCLKIKFKYSFDKETEQRHVKNVTDFLAKISSIKSDAFYREYLDNLIKSIIDSMLGLCDVDLLSDINYYKIIFLQWLLRAVFLIIGDYRELVQYEEYYNEKEQKETVSKKMIREAFIAHYNDAMLYPTKKLTNNKNVDL